MKILNISLDENIADKNSASAKRAVKYGEIVAKYTVLVLADKDEVFNLSDKVKIITLKKGNKFFSLLKLKKKAEKILKSDQYDIITVQDVYYIGRLAVKLAQKFNLGLEVQVHGWEKINFFRRLIARYVLQQADAVRVVSQRLHRQLIGEFSVAENKITVAPIYTEIRSKKLEVRNYEKRAGEKFIFLAVGRLVSIKNIKIQIEATQSVVRQFPRAELWIVGDGPQRKALQVKSQKHAPPASPELQRGESDDWGSKVKSQIKFFGWQENLEKFYSEADVFLLTSYSEGWGMVLVEAASFGLPIIMTDVGLAGEIIKNGESGIVIPVGGQKALEESMTKLIEDKNLREKLGKGARAAIDQLPSEEKTLALYKKAWEKIL